MRDSMIADSNDINFACIQCGQRMVVERSAAGMGVECPACRTGLVVPHGSTLERGTRVEELEQQPSARTNGLETGSYVPATDELGHAKAEFARLQASHKKALDECERLKANATHVQAELKSFHADRQQLKTELAGARQALLTAEQRVMEYSAALAAAQQENARLQDYIAREVQRLQEALGTAEQRLAAREQDLAERQNELAHTARSLAKARAEHSASLAEALALREEADAHRCGLQSTAEKLTATEAALGASESSLRTLQAQFETLRTAHEEAIRERGEWQGRAESMEQDLRAVDNGRELLALRDDFEKLQRENLALESKLKEQGDDAEKNSSALRGIINRQNTTLEVYHAELRRLRRKRYGVRLIYGIFALAALALGVLALNVFGAGQLARLFGH